LIIYLSIENNNTERRSKNRLDSEPFYFI